MRLDPRPPTVAELRGLAEAVGWTDHYDWETVGDALAASRHGVVALEGGEVAGAARAVGDGTHYLYIQDVIVHPAHQDAGIASQMTALLVERIRRTAGTRVLIGLFASPEAEGVYRDLGFAEPGDMTGMVWQG